MFATVLRDAPRIPALQPFVMPHYAYLESVRDGLYEGFARASDDTCLAGEREEGVDLDGERDGEAEASQGLRMRTFLDHAIQFTTWQTLSRQEIDDNVMSSIMVDAVSGVARSCPDR